MAKWLLCPFLTGVLFVPLPSNSHSPRRCFDLSCGTVAFADASPSQASPAPSSGIEAPRHGPWGVDTAGMDPSIEPGDDFFGFVNGTWAKSTKIPGDRPSYGTFSRLRELSERRVRQLVESHGTASGMADEDSTGDRLKTAVLYRSYMDEEAVESLDTKPLQPYLETILAASSKDDLARLMGRSIGGFGQSFFAPAVNDDRRNPDYYALHLRQAGLGLSDRDFYLDPKFAAHKDRYHQYVRQLLSIIAWPHAEAAASKVISLETALAEAHWTRAESRDREKTYNMMLVSDLQRNAPGFPWPLFFEAAGTAKAERAIVAEPSAFTKLAAIFQTEHIDTLKAWEAFHTADQAAPLLSKRFVGAHFAFRSRFLLGQPDQRDRWKRAVAFVENSMGEAIGRDYVRLYYPAASKALMDEMVANIRLAMKQRIEGLQWMGAQTKAQALQKLATFGLKIGHPARWRDYSGLEVRTGDLFGNAARALRFEWDFRRNRIARPVDKSEWNMTPQTVNAYYSSQKNEIVFPAAILQPPYFDPQADPAVNYGAIGAVIGHEVTHGFDDQGRKSDGQGMLRDWWTAEDAAKFEAQAARLGAQYEGYSFPTLPGMRINSRVSMGENIADLGGVLLALEAYRELLAGRPAPVLDGFTGEQRLFMGWAQVWRIVWRDEALRQQLVNGPHSPGQIRALAPLRNVDEWYRTFNVQPEDKLFVSPDDRVRIW